MRGETDARFGKRARGDPRGRAPLAYASLYTHLWQVYTSHAETMPDADVILPANPTEPVSEENRNQVAAFRAASGTHLPPNPRMIQKGRSGFGFLIEPSEDCPVRRLPPSCRKDIWWLYLASMQEQGFKRPQGSYSTLKRVRKECFEKGFEIFPIWKALRVQYVLPTEGGDGPGSVVRGQIGEVQSALRPS